MIDLHIHLSTSPIIHWLRTQARIEQDAQKTLSHGPQNANRPFLDLVRQLNIKG